MAQVRHHLDQHCPKILEAIGDLLRHSIAIEIQQHERRAVLAIDDLALGAGDGVCLSIELFLGTILTLSGSPSPQRAQRDRLVRPELREPGGERMQVGDRRAACRSFRHSAFRSVTSRSSHPWTG